MTWPSGPRTFTVWPALCWRTGPGEFCLARFPTQSSEFPVDETKIKGRQSQKCCLKAFGGETMETMNSLKPDLGDNLVNAFQVLGTEGQRSRHGRTENHWEVAHTHLPHAPKPNQWWMVCRVQVLQETDGGHRWGYCLACPGRASPLFCHLPDQSYSETRHS